MQSINSQRPTPRRYGLYSKIKIPLRTMNYIIGVLVALVAIALIVGIMLGGG
jgi:hypothetical protein